MIYLELAGAIAPARDRITTQVSVRSIAPAKVPRHDGARLAPEVEPLLTGLGLGGMEGATCLWAATEKLV